MTLSSLSREPVAALRRRTSRRLSLFLPALEGGGAERAFLTIADLLAREGHDVVLVVGSRRGALRSEVQGVELVDLGCERLRSALPGLVTHLRRRRPDCLLATLHNASVLALVASRWAGVGTPVLVRLANAIGNPAAQEHPPARLTLAAARRLYPLADVLAAPSAGLAEDTERELGLPVGRVRVLPNPVVGSDLPLRAAEPLDHPWFAPGQPPVVLGVGRLTAQKNFGELLQAFALARGRTRARLVLLGDGPERESLRAQIRALRLHGEVSMPGFDPNPLRYMARAEVLALTSRYEGLPAVLIQALACGTKTVATDCPSGPREILAGGIHGRLVPVGDVPALAGALAEGLVAPPSSVSPDAWLRYSEQRALTYYGEVLEELVWARRRSLRVRARGGA